MVFFGLIWYELWVWCVKCFIVYNATERSNPLYVSEDVMSNEYFRKVAVIRLSQKIDICRNIAIYIEKHFSNMSCCWRMLTYLRHFWHPKKVWRKWQTISIRYVLGRNVQVDMTPLKAVMKCERQSHDASFDFYISFKTCRLYYNGFNLLLVLNHFYYTFTPSYPKWEVAATVNLLFTDLWMFLHPYRPLYPSIKKTTPPIAALV